MFIRKIYQYLFWLKMNNELMIMNEEKNTTKKLFKKNKKVFSKKF